MIPTINFLAPSLHPNTLTDVSVPVPSSSYNPQDPIVRHLAIKHGDHLPVGSVKQMAMAQDGKLLVADDSFRISTLKLSTDEPAPPEVVEQYSAPSKAGSIWIGMAPTASGIVAALSSGHASYHPYASGASEAPAQEDAEASATTKSPERTAALPSGPTCIASSSRSTSSFAVAGKEVDVSVWDVERAFASSSLAGSSDDVDMSNGKNAKRKKDALLPGELWRAKNLPNDSLSLRPPIHHLSLTYLNDSDTLLASGTKSGHVRRYDTRQRKPLSNWKIAREGGIGCVCPLGENELFFSDRSGLLGSLDLRTGKLLYTLPSTATPHHLLALPKQPHAFGSKPLTRTIGLASISSDATMRISSTTPPPAGTEGAKGNWRNGQKAEIAGSVRGVGIGSFVCTGWGEIEEPAKVKSDGKAKGDGGDEDGSDEEDEDDEDEEGEDVWDGMEEVDGDESEDDSEEEEEVVQPKKQKQRR